jgi:hypothetical protein
MMDINAKIVEMFWGDYKAKGGNDVPDLGQTLILRDFLAWLDQRTAEGPIIDSRPLQQAFANALSNVKKPVIMLVEAPMGEGKTEAAFYAHLELQRRFGHRGLYVAFRDSIT